MKIVVLDGYTVNPGDNPWHDLGRLGDLEVYDRTPPELVIDRARDVEVVLTNKTRLGAGTFAALPRLRFVAVLATGYDVVDVEAARERGIPVANVPEYGTDSVAQHAIALILELAQRVGEHHEAVRAGEWSRAADFSFWKRPPIELAGATLGLVGLGRIGRRVAGIGRSLGMRVIAASRSRLDAPTWADFAWRTIPELFAESDVVSLHCPATRETAGLVDRHLLSLMKPTAFLVNTARGTLVDETALAEALNDGRIAGAAVDVVSEEPVRPGNPLLGARNCIVTPHMAWASLAARRRLMAATVRNVEAFLAGAPIHRVS